MGTTHDNTIDDQLELMREMKPDDLERLQRDLSESDRNDNQTADQRPGGSE